MILLWASSVYDRTTGWAKFHLIWHLSSDHILEFTGGTLCGERISNPKGTLPWGHDLRAYDFCIFCVAANAEANKD